MILFRVLGDPKGQPRPRAFAFKGKARVFDPGTAEHWKSQIALAARGHLPPAPVETAVSLSLTFRFARPASHFGKKKGVAYLKPQHARLAYTKKPDGDNLAKAVMDCLTTLGVWKDDAQVSVLFVRKEWATKDDPPGVTVDATWADEAAPEARAAGA